MGRMLILLGARQSRISGLRSGRNSHPAGFAEPRPEEAVFMFSQPQATRCGEEERLESKDNDIGQLQSRPLPESA